MNNQTMFIQGIIITLWFVFFTNANDYWTRIITMKRLVTECVVAIDVFCTAPVLSCLRVLWWHGLIMLFVFHGSSWYYFIHVVCHRQIALGKPIKEMAQSQKFIVPKFWCLRMSALIRLQWNTLVGIIIVILPTSPAHKIHDCVYMCLLFRCAHKLDWKCVDVGEEVYEAATNHIWSTAPWISPAVYVEGMEGRQSSTRKIPPPSGRPRHCLPCLTLVR